MICLITGIAGQDGSYLSELLLAKGHTVHGIVRRNSTPEHQQSRIDGLDITTHYGDVTDSHSLKRIFSDVKPDMVFHLAAQSHVRISFDIPEHTAQVNAIGSLNVFESARLYADPDVRVYFAASSELFGSSVDEDGFQRESTPMHPTSPYGCAKLYAYSMARHYRNAYGMFISNGILFNHTSPRRGSNFVIAKIAKTAVEISLGLKDELVLGNIDPMRDFGHSKDYVRAMLMILEHNKPDDFVVATGDTRSIRDVCEEVFSILGMDYRSYLKQDEKFMRPQELMFLRGDSLKVRVTLGWDPEYLFHEICQEIVNEWREHYARLLDARSRENE